MGVPSFIIVAMRILVLKFTVGEIQSMENQLGLILVGITWEYNVLYTTVRYHNVSFWGSIRNGYMNKYEL